MNIHPDKVQQKGGTTAHRFVADKARVCAIAAAMVLLLERRSSSRADARAQPQVFHTMLEAYNSFASKEL